MECSIINQALSLLMKHLVIGQRQKAPSFSAFHWSRHGSLVYIGQHFVTTRVVHIPKRIETILITEADLITESDPAVRAVPSCNSWFFPFRVDRNSCKIIRHYFRKRGLRESLLELNKLKCHNISLTRISVQFDDHVRAIVNLAIL